MAQIKKQYPGKSADEIFAKVHQVMGDIAQKMGLKYDSDAAKKTGKVSKMGVTGTYAAKEGEVLVDLSFPMLLPGSMKQKVQEDIERKLNGLFG